MSKKQAAGQEGLGSEMDDGMERFGTAVSRAWQCFHSALAVYKVKAEKHGKGARF